MLEHGQVPDRWTGGVLYEQYMGRWSRGVAPQFLSWLNVPAGVRWLDVGCGTGALSAAVMERCSPRSLVGIEPSPGFLESARASLGGRSQLLQGSAQAIPLGDASVDVVVSALVLNFVPDPVAGLSEMVRVTSDGGTVAAYVWDYAGKMDLLRVFWDAAGEVDPKAAPLDEGDRFPLCRPDALEDAFRGAGLKSVELRAIDTATTFQSFEDYWTPFLGGQGPAPSYVAALDEITRVRLRERIRAQLPIAADGTIALTARAWAAKGRVAERAKYD